MMRKVMKKSVLIFVFTILLIGVVSAGSLKVTQEHPFLIDGEWVVAKDLQVGDELTTLDGKNVRITNIKDISLDFPVKVYNLEANTFKNFVIKDGVVVHNSNVECTEGYDKEKNIELGNIVYEYRIRGKESGITSEEFEDAKNGLVENNQKLIDYFIYRKYKKFERVLDESERLSAAYFGLSKAIRTFNPNRGTTFGTWAYKLIEQQIKSDFNNKIHGSEVFPEGYLDIFKYIEEFKLTEGYEPAVSDVMNRFPEFGEVKVRNALSEYNEIHRSLLSIDKPIGEDDDIYCYEDVKSVSPLEESTKSEEIEIVKNFVYSDLINNNMRRAVIMNNEGHLLIEIGMTLKMLEDGFTESQIAEAISLRRGYLKKTFGDALEKVKNDLKEMYGKDDNFISVSAIQKQIYSAKTKTNPNADEIELLNLKNQGYSYEEIVLILGMRKGGYTKKQIDNSIKLYRSYIKKVPEKKNIRKD